MLLRSSFSIGLGFALAACTPSYEAEPNLSEAPPPKVTATAPPKVEAPKALDSAMIRTLYRDDWFGGVTLLGIDRKNLRAVVRLDSQDPPRVAIDTIDLRKKERVDRWEATGDQAKRAMRGPSFTPFSGSLEEDLARFAGVVDNLGPWHLRHPLSSPTFAVGNHERVLFGAKPPDGSQGDWLYVRSKSSKAKRIDAGNVASYSPSFAPDGEAVAFIGCTGSPCDYGLYITKMGDERPRRVPGINRATAPMWTANGDAVLTVGTRGAERCLFRVPLDTATPRSLACARGLEDVSFAQDPEGRTAAFAGVRGVPGKQVVDVKWLLVADGSVLGTQTIDRAVGSSVLSSSGLMALPMQRGAVSAVDLVTGASTLIPESEGWFFGFEGARWVEDSLIVLRKMPDRKGFDIVAIDVRQASGRRADPWM